MSNIGDLKLATEMMERIYAEGKSEMEKLNPNISGKDKEELEALFNQMNSVVDQAKANTIEVTEEMKKQWGS